MSRIISEELASIIRSSIRLTRADVFGDVDDQMPESEPSDAHVPQIGYVGVNYWIGGDLLLGLNPAGGGDPYHRTIGDSILLPKILKIRHGTGSEEDISEIFRVCAENMRTWGLWRIVAPVLAACCRQQQDIAFLNWCPFRTRNGRVPAEARRNCSRLHVAPLVKALAPGRVIALGMKVGGWLDKTTFAGAETFVVPRTNGDSYLEARAKLALEQIRKSTNKRANG